ncbi:uncharacterized protein LOC103856863 [Brassica rapa]|uniref:uncharacterized protein LOC103856863 n=1 Tax=Brassica campestris TaxID=3711 RepID=UPI0006AB24B1|nr:uncharacterized protein LOC103856863 [Brassica rapa]XP_022575816.1 uncharacterized protein LOC111215882 [Brassica napus]
MHEGIFSKYSKIPQRTAKKVITDDEEGERRIQMAARSSLIRFAFVCIVLAVLVMTAESHAGHHHGPAKAPAMAPGAPAPSAATFSAYPQLIATALVGALSFVF